MFVIRIKDCFNLRHVTKGRFNDTHHRDLLNFHDAERVGAGVCTSSLAPPRPQLIAAAELDGARGAGRYGAVIHDTATDLPPLVKVALIHAQFETIHPFLDGNGRIGRLLFATLFKHWGLLSEPLMYLSGYLKQHQADRRRLLQSAKAGSASYRLSEMLPMMPRFTIERVRQQKKTKSPKT